MILENIKIPATSSKIYNSHTENQATPNTTFYKVQRVNKEQEKKIAQLVPQ